jgi:hypothetical protein
MWVLETPPLSARNSVSGNSGQKKRVSKSLPTSHKNSRLWVEIRLEVFLHKNCEEKNKFKLKTAEHYVNMPFISMLKMHCPKNIGKYFELVPDAAAQP